MQSTCILLLDFDLVIIPQYYSHTEDDSHLLLCQSPLPTALSKSSSSYCDPHTLHFQDMAVTTDNACGILTDGSVECWGSNSHQQSTPPSGKKWKVTLAQTLSPPSGIRRGRQMESKRESNSCLPLMNFIRLFYSVTPVAYQVILFVALHSDDIRIRSKG